MSQVYVSIGSNIDRTKHIIAGLDNLSVYFGRLVISSVYESDSVGFDGAAFFNLVVGFETDFSIAELFHCLRAIEFDNGRRRSCSKFSSRTLDIDILSYDDCSGEIDGVELPRAEINHNAFVLWPLAEIAPQVVHPVSGVAYGQLWVDFDKQSQKLKPIDFFWNREKISSAG
jgi:2-amino-4-hydroxy-6-hydroxymethyldihydropteridine diphosphokinase